MRRVGGGGEAAAVGVGSSHEEARRRVRAASRLPASTSSEKLSNDMSSTSSWLRCVRATPPTLAQYVLL